MPTKVPANQNPDSRQGGEGTNSFHGKSYDALLKNIGTPPGNTAAEMPAKDVGTK